MGYQIKMQWKWGRQSDLDQQLCRERREEVKVVGV